MTDEEMDILEKQIPYLAVAALKLAYHQALAAGLSVVVAEDDALYEVFPDGTRKFIEKLPPRKPYTGPMRLELK